jgi:hypothetical protein
MPGMCYTNWLLFVELTGNRTNVAGQVIGKKLIYQSTHKGETKTGKVDERKAVKSRAGIWK